MSFSNAGPISMTQVSQMDTIMKQFKLKLSMYRGSIGMMIMAQLLGLLLSYGGYKSTFHMGGEEGDVLKLALIHYNGQGVFIFPILVMVGLAFSLGMKRAKNTMASYVTTGTTNVFANTLLISTLSTCIGVTSYMLMIVFKLIVFQVEPISEFILLEIPTIPQMLLGCFAVILYTLLFSMFAYFLGELLSFHKVFFAIVIVIAFLIFGFYGLIGIDTVRDWLATFYMHEGSMILFSSKVLGSCVILFCFNLFMVHKEEVRI